jgi:hypothetical protein
MASSRQRFNLLKSSVLMGAFISILGGHPKPAINGHLKTGHFE